MTTIKLAGVKAYERKGTIYYYLRATGKRIVDPISGKPIDPVTDPAGFAQRVEAMKTMLAAVTPDGGARRPVKAGDLLELIREWTGEPERPALDGQPAVKRREPSPEWAALRPSTRRSYERVVDPEKGHVRRALKRPLDRVPLDLISKPFIAKLRNKVAAKAGFWFGNYTVAVLRSLFTWANLYGHMTGNPAEDVPKLGRPDDMPEQHRSWAESEYAAMYDGAIERGWKGVALAMALARYAGWASGDMCNQPARVWQDPRLVFVRRKKRKKVVTSIRVPSVLLVVLRELAPPADAEGLVLNEKGERYTDDGLRSMMWRLNRILTDAGKTQMGLTIHGLRHSLGKEMYDLGIEREARKAMMSHESDAASKVYERDGDRGAMADSAVVILDRAHASRAKK